MKRAVSVFLIFIMCLCSVCVFAYSADYAERSVYRTFIDYTPIDAYLINGFTYIEAEAMINYGFTVTFDKNAQSYNISRIKFATPMYTREMWEKETAMKTGAPVTDSNIKVYLDGQLANSRFADGKILLQIDELQKYGTVEWSGGIMNVYIFKDEMQRELDSSENIVEIEFEGATYKGQVDENNQPHGIGMLYTELDYKRYNTTYLGYFTHSRPDGLIYKETYYCANKSYVPRYTYFIGKTDGNKTDNRIYVEGEDGRQVLIGRDPNFGISYLPEKEVEPWTGTAYIDDTVYTEGCYFEFWTGMHGEHNHRIWYDGIEKETILHYSFGAGQGKEAIDSVRRLGTDASHLVSFYEYTNGVLDMHTGAVQTVSGKGAYAVLNSPADGGGAFITVMMNNEGIEFDVLPIKQNDRVLVPVRAIAESLGAKVLWKNDTKTATVTKDGKTVTLQIGNNVMKINDKEVVLDVAPQIVDGRTLVPVRAISEGFDAVVDWNNSLQQVVITK